MVTIGSVPNSEGLDSIMEQCTRALRVAQAMSTHANGRVPDSWLARELANSARAIKRLRTYSSNEYGDTEYYAEERNVVHAKICVQWKRMQEAVHELEDFANRIRDAAQQAKQLMQMHALLSACPDQ